MKITREREKASKERKGREVNQTSVRFATLHRRKMKRMEQKRERDMQYRQCDGALLERRNSADIEDRNTQPNLGAKPF